MNKKKILNLVLFIIITIIGSETIIESEIEFMLMLLLLPVVFIAAYIYYLFKKEKFYDLKSFDNCLLYTNVIFIIVYAIQYAYNTLYVKPLLKLLDYSDVINWFLIIGIPIFAFVYFLLFIWMMALKKKRVKDK